MHRQFVRLLCAILFILLIVSVVQLVCITVFSQRVVYAWSGQVFDEFVNNISSSLSSASFTDTSNNIYDYVFSNVSERISGFILRSSSGSQMLSFGQSGRGQIIPQLSSFVNNSFTYIDDVSKKNSKIKTSTYELDNPKYKLSVTLDSPLSMIITSASLIPTKDEGKMPVAYPSSVNRSDIAGTISIYINDSLFAYLDVLVYSVDYYTPTKFVLYEVYRVILISIGFVIIVGFILAYVVSKRTEKNIKSIEEALNQISEGHFDITVQDSKVEEYNRIGNSIMELGRDLKRHSDSRKEWIRNISHDLNTPLTSMNMVLEGVSDGLFPFNQETVRVLKKENDTLIERIASVAYYSYLLSPDVRCEKEEVLLSSSLDLTRGKIKERVIENFDPEFTLYCDVKLFSRALEEILRNSLEYRNSTREPMVSAYVGNCETVIKVSNDGSLPSPLPQFFEPWSRGDSSRTQGGSGMGLPIVYQIMELHSASVTIEEENSVVVVTLKLPHLNNLVVI